MEIKDRLQMLIKELASSQSDFAEKIGITRAAISHILRGRNNMSADVMNKIVTTFPNVTYQWLHLGKGKSPIFTNTLHYANDTAENPPKENIVHNDEVTTEKPQEKKTVKKEKVAPSFSSGEKTVEKIVFIYKDGTFQVFHND